MVTGNQVTGSGVEALLQSLRARPELVGGVLREMETRAAKDKFACSKALRLLSEQAPASLYLHFDRFVELLDCENSFLRWDAARVLAGLATVDKQRKIEAILDHYLEPIRGPEMIGAATAIACAARIALAKPELANRMSHAILWVERARYKSEECRNIAIGHAIDALDSFFDLIGDPQWVMAFIERQAGNPRSATRKKAERFLKRHKGEAAAAGAGR